MKTPWLDDYQAKKWTVYKVDAVSSDYAKFNSLVGKTDIYVCGAESERAKELWENGRREKILYFDFEQLFGMDMDQVYGVGSVGVLTEEWMGHPAGSLTMSVFRGITDSPPTIAVAIANPS